MSLASSDKGGSWGKTTGFSRILQENGKPSILIVTFLRTLYSLFVNLDGVLVPEWRIPRQEFIYQDTQCPPIDCASVTLILDYLRGEVLGCSTECICLDGTVVFLVTESLSKAKVDKLNVTLLIQKQVLRLEVSVSDATLLFVQILQNENNFSGIELSDGLLKATQLPQVCE